MHRFEGKVAVVTGASMGIGAAIARALARAGVHLVLAARSAERLDQLAAQLQTDYGVRVLAVATDISDRAQVEALMERAEAELGGVDILVNNAGVGVQGPVSAVAEQDIRAAFDVNVFGVVAAIQAVVPLMRRRGGGVIVNMGSVVALIPLAQLGPTGASATYCASKFALRAFSLGARAELASQNIRVVTMQPGLTETDFSRHVLRPSAVEVSRSRHPIKRLLTVSPQRVAARTLLAIQRGEREVFITWWDRLAVTLFAAFPALLDWGLQAALSRAQTRSRSGVSSRAGARGGSRSLGLLASLLVVGGLALWHRRQ